MMRTLLVTVVLACLVAPFVPTSEAQVGTGEQSISIATNKTDQTGATGDIILFSSTVTNQGTTATGPILVFLSIVDLSQGTPLDLEDWTATRSFTVTPIEAGGNATQHWTLRAIIQGNYAVHVLAIRNATSAANERLAASPPLTMHIAQRAHLDPGGVLPVLLATPLVLLFALVGITSWRRRRTSMGGRPRS